jgi:integrase
VGLSWAADYLEQLLSFLLKGNKMPQSPKHKTHYPGVRFREHPTRKFNGKQDKYFFVRYRYQGRLKEEGLGWASEGWNASKASGVLGKLKQSIKLGEGPQTLAEKRRILKEKQEAEQARREREARENITFGHIFLNQYSSSAENDKGERSVRREKDLFKLWISPVIGNLPLKDISAFHLERIKKNMSDAGRSPRSVRYALAVIRQVFNFAKFNNLYGGEVPVGKVRMPQADNKRYRYLSHEEAGRLLGYLASKSPQVYEMALISLHCGLRAGEIFSLTWGDLEFQNGTMFLKDTKGGRNRTAFMTQAVKERLKAKTPGEKDDLVFPGRDGVKISSIPNTFDRAIEKLGFNTGVTDRRQKVVFHTLRHTYASWLVEEGVDLYTVKKLMGHSTISMTERYSHLGNDTLQNAVKVLEESLKEKEEKAASKQVSREKRDLQPSPELNNGPSAQVSGGEVRKSAKGRRKRDLQTVVGIPQEK